ncbi:MAG: dihydrodipicolinate synthase family protein [Clostridia bacterium]|jgi:dihydrodipicolinate synthase/N-acetylneuraminate lyase|nr:dihydrodipicolinate synthase family protein [Clostridia bacterium]MBT7123428.1 dihydrodipicolinate synthase family protein [Clostridia bacterium]
MKKRYPRMALATVLVPWTHEFKLEEGMFRECLKILVDSGVKFIYTFGTAGEGYSVDEEQFEQITRVQVEELSDTGVTPIAGVISLSTSEMINRIRVACELGVRDFQISFPSWGELTDEEVDVFFHQVCDPFPECRFMHYNNGGRSKKMLKAKDYIRLAQQIPNLVAVKFMNDSLADVINVVRADTPIQFILSERGYGYGCLFGECSMLFSSIITHLPSGWALYNAGIEKDIDEIVRLEKEVAVSQEVLFSTCTTPVIDAAYDKLYIKSFMPAFPMRLYPPYQTISDEQVSAYMSAMRQALPQWFE